MKIAADVDISKLSKKMQGYVGADIEGVCREAAMIALREDIDAKEVKIEHFQKALDVVKASVDKEVEEMYQNLETYFSSARAKQIKDEKESYFG
ncbi:hypothetical protein COV20_00005 [Candidatus Woesearchaeota archaeon CG10_big_fil_rev_8_21_14_0_10_45_16]|nr:MAG: hypothetical protein COV20_00005 [Candidatus Woesearchaeota archaeon CG10_big_fil_rev_8_21_14_0_10_45_16]